MAAVGPRQTERQQAAQGLLHVHLALVATRFEDLVDSSLDIESPTTWLRKPGRKPAQKPLRD